MSERYRHSAEMGEISGFGGGYESCCQDMFEAGMNWLQENPRAEPKYQGFKNIYGVIVEDNPDAKALTKAVIDAAKGEATGAMHQAVISRLLWIKAHSWKEYVDILVKDESQENNKS